MSAKFFPIVTDTACPLKWSWSTLHLDAGTTASCHRTAVAKIDVDNFDSFHNAPVKIADRQRMLQGQWPESNCAYCRNIESVGGFSDRNVHLSIPNMYPESLDQEISVEVQPTILEVYFENTCNLACLYCRPKFSSRINAEYLRFGNFDQGSVKLIPIEEKKAADLIPRFWQWLPKNVHSLKRLQVLGGEPLVQTHIDDLLDFFTNNPAPQLEFNIVTNLAVSQERLVRFTEKVKTLLISRKLKRLDISASIDCLGPEQEYVRYGLDLNQFQKNFEYLLAQKWIKLNINQTISVLTIKTMPELLDLVAHWKTVRSIGHYFSRVPDPYYMQTTILGADAFREDFEKILSRMPQFTNEEQVAYNYMCGIQKEIVASKFDNSLVKDLFVFLDETDRRHSTSWQQTFPWLMEFKNRVV